MIKILLILRMLYCMNDIYSYDILAADGSTIHMSDFKGKKILIVNTASGSRFASQYQGLDTLAAQYAGSLVVIAIPSNDFGHQPEADSVALQSIQATYGSHFLVAAKAVVSGAGQCDLFHWLTTGSLNGTMSRPVNDDFQKYLVDEEGKVIAYFSSPVSPVDEDIKASISN